MGITIIHKSGSKQKKKNSKIALVLAGGAVTGAAFKIGGLKAFNDYLENKKLTDFDIYVGLSAGAILAVPLCGGVSPAEMLASLDGKSKSFSQIAPIELYRPNWAEIIRRPISYWVAQTSFFPNVLWDGLLAIPQLRNHLFEQGVRFIKWPSYSNYEKLLKPLFKAAVTGKRIPDLSEIIPSGIFNNKPIEVYLRTNMKKNGMPNNFKDLRNKLKKSLYISAVNLDTSEPVVFGADEKNDVTISEAAQASSAVPGFYKPARIKGVDYVDGGILKTLNIDLAFEKGADLVICYNPFRPYNNKKFLDHLGKNDKHITRNKRISDWGMGTVFNQVFRTLVHSRLLANLESFKNNPNFKKDIVLIQPTEDDADFFTMNPLLFWNRAKAAKIGFESVLQSIEKNYRPLSSLLNLHGIRMSRSKIKKDVARLKKVGLNDSAIMDVLENR